MLYDVVRQLPSGVISQSVKAHSARFTEVYGKDRQAVYKITGANMFTTMIENLQAFRTQNLKNENLHKLNQCINCLKVISASYEEGKDIEYIEKRIAQLKQGIAVWTKDDNYSALNAAFEVVNQEISALKKVVDNRKFNDEKILLSAELIRIITSYLTDRDQSRFSRSCTFFYQVTNEVLKAKAEIHFKKENDSRQSFWLLKSMNILD